MRPRIYFNIFSLTKVINVIDLTLVSEFKESGENKFVWKRSQQSGRFSLFNYD